MTKTNNAFSLEGKVALVTGAARGIGADIANVLAGMGAAVVITDREHDLGLSVAANLTAKGFKATFLPLDVTAEDQWKQVMADIQARYSRLDILVNNAGIFAAQLVEDLNIDDFRRMQSINVEGVILGCKHAATLMKASATPDNRASIINLSSLAGLVGSAGLTSYCSSKGSVRLLSKAMAAEFGAQHIRVNSIHPGLIQTDMGDMVKDLLKDQLGLPSQEAAHEVGLALTPLRAWGTTTDVANAVAFLASNASNFMTGSELVVDGGISNCQ